MSESASSSFPPPPEHAPDEQPEAKAPEAQPAGQHILRNRAFVRIFSAQVVSSLGDWVGLLAVIAIATRISKSGTAVGLVMTARMLPGFIFAPIGGALIDRWDRRKVMVTCDIGRACLLISLPFFDSLIGLIVIS